jgi:hypothetical protein
MPSQAKQSVWSFYLNATKNTQPICLQKRKLRKQNFNKKYFSHSNPPPTFGFTKKYINYGKFSIKKSRRNTAKKCG